MPPTRKRNNTSQRKSASGKKEKLDKSLDTENSNDNHVATSDDDQSERLDRATRRYNKEDVVKKSSKKIKTKIKAQFDEDQDVVNMELDGKIDNSDEEDDSDDSSSDDSEDERVAKTNTDTENDQSDLEEGERRDQEGDTSQTQSQTEKESTENESDSESSAPRSNKKMKTDDRKATKKQKHKERRQSMKNQIQSLSSTVQAMQAIIEQRGLEDNNSRSKSSHVRSEVHKVQRRQNEEGKSVTDYDDTISEVTIYKTAVAKDNNDRYDVDPEVSFKLRQSHDSSSSEDKIDTSDELMEVDTVDIPEQFIADCERQAARDEQCRRLDDRNKYRREERMDETDPMEQSQRVI